METIEDDKVLIVEVVKPVECFEEEFSVGSVYKAIADHYGYMLQEPGKEEFDCLAYSDEVRVVESDTELSSADQGLMGIDKILDARGSKYGDYETRAAIEWALHQAVMDSPNFPVLSPGQKTSVFMILHKLSRILAGDPNHEDSWTDIAGYAQLIVGGDTLRDN